MGKDKEQMVKKIKTAKQLREKYESDLKKLQEKCSHEKSTWMDNVSSSGHIYGTVLVCDFCDKVIDSNSIFGAHSLMEFITIDMSSNENS